MADASLQRRECQIHFIHSDTFHMPRLVLKAFLGDGDPNSNYLKKLRWRNRHLEAGATAEFAVPKLVLALVPHNALVMEFVHGPSAGALLKKANFSPAKRAAIIRQSARWLRWLHDQSRITIEPFDASKFVRKLIRTADKIDANPPLRGGDAFLNTCLATAIDLANNLNGRPLPHAAVHGDFTPFNLFIQGSKTIGFDFHSNNRLPVFHDISRFLCYLDVYRWPLAGSDELRSTGCRRVDCEAFMAAYGAGDFPEWGDAALWQQLQFMEITRRIISLTLSRPKLLTSMFHLARIQCLRRNASHMLAGLEHRRIPA